MSENSGPWPKTQTSLMIRIQNAADHQAWMEIMEIYVPLLLHYCKRRGLQAADADDVASTVVAKMRRFVYSKRKGRFRNWLATVTRREVLRHLKTARLAVVGRGGLGREDDRIADDVVHADPDWDGIYKAHIFDRAATRVLARFSLQEQEWIQILVLEKVETVEGYRWHWKSPCYEVFTRTKVATYARLTKLVFNFRRQLEVELIKLAGDGGFI